MKKVIFFDIDRTLFDVETFLNDFYVGISFKFKLTDESLDEIKSLYKQVKLEMGYFIPSLFLDRIHNSFSNITPTELHSLFWGELVQKNLYTDVDELNELSKSVKIGIFSKGDEKFQKEKLKKFEKIVNEKDVYIFPSKIEELKEVLSKYSEYKIYLIDDDVNILQKIKEYNSKIFTILIDRKKNMVKFDKIDAKVENLYQIKELI